MMKINYDLWYETLSCNIPGWADFVGLPSGSTFCKEKKKTRKKITISRNIYSTCISEKLLFIDTHCTHQIEVFVWGSAEQDFGWKTVQWAGTGRFIEYTDTDF